MAVNGLAARFLAAGFYYKTFMWPPKAWTGLYEKAIRRAAGLGRASHAPDPDHYDKRHAFCDVLVVGGGPAGLMAALVAGRAGARVILADEMPALGGRLRHESRQIDGTTAGEWLTGQLRELAALPNVQALSRTSVFGAYDHGTFAAVERVTDHLPPAERGGLAAPALLADPGTGGDHRDGRHRARHRTSRATTCPASCWPRPPAATCTSTA